MPNNFGYEHLLKIIIRELELYVADRSPQTDRARSESSFGSVSPPTPQLHKPAEVAGSTQAQLETKAALLELRRKLESLQQQKKEKERLVAELRTQLEKRSSQEVASEPEVAKGALEEQQDTNPELQELRASLAALLEQQKELAPKLVELQQKLDQALAEEKAKKNAFHNARKSDKLGKENEYHSAKANREAIAEEHTTADKALEELQSQIEAKQQRICELQQQKSSEVAKVEEPEQAPLVEVNPDAQLSLDATLLEIAQLQSQIDEAQRETRELQGSEHYEEEGTEGMSPSLLFSYMRSAAGSVVEAAYRARENAGSFFTNPDLARQKKELASELISRLQSKLKTQTSKEELLEILQDTKESSIRACKLARESVGGFDYRLDIFIELVERYFSPERQKECLNEKLHESLNRMHGVLLNLTFDELLYNKINEVNEGQEAYRGFISLFKPAASLLSRPHLPEEQRKQLINVVSRNIEFLFTVEGIKPETAAALVDESLELNVLNARSSIKEQQKSELNDPDEFLNNLVVLGAQAQASNQKFTPKNRW